MGAWGVGVYSNKPFFARGSVFMKDLLGRCHIYTHICTYICTHIHIYMYIHMCIYIHQKRDHTSQGLQIYLHCGFVQHAWMSVNT